MTSTVHRILCALPLIAASLACAAQERAQKLPAIRLNAGIHNIQAEVAQTPDERATGLMFRKSMGANTGMLFAFEDAATQCFWMKNTLLPLSVAFIDDSGTIINVEDMAPQTEDSHCAKRPARYALEMNRGWFAARGIKPGTRLGGIPGVKP